MHVWFVKVKALVWFWWIDETLDTNLLALVIMRIGKHIPSGRANDDDHDEDDGGVHGDDQVLRLGKEEREKQKAQGKGETW